MSRQPIPDGGGLLCWLMLAALITAALILAGCTFTVPGPHVGIGDRRVGVNFEVYYEQD